MPYDDTLPALWEDITLSPGRNMGRVLDGYISMGTWEEVIGGGI